MGKRQISINAIGQFYTFLIVLVTRPLILTLTCWFFCTLHLLVLWLTWNGKDHLWKKNILTISCLPVVQLNTFDQTLLSILSFRNDPIFRGWITPDSWVDLSQIIDGCVAQLDCCITELTIAQNNTTITVAALWNWHELVSSRTSIIVSQQLVLKKSPPPYRKICKSVFEDVAWYTFNQ